jgi:hypothetical protein
LRAARAEYDSNQHVVAMRRLALRSCQQQKLELQRRWLELPVRRTAATVDLFIVVSP